MRRPAVGLAVLFTVALTTITTETLPMGLLPQMSHGLGASQDRIGWLVGGYSLIIIAFNLGIIAGSTLGGQTPRHLGPGPLPAGPRVRPAPPRHDRGTADIREPT
ncbi:hypothetical protein [Microtetraspora malaysiensis]|uniref:Major facilitator superfamily (MFS) profile domain-containing protein n=1 Tax=Microtetraspora malaysiensis TaxID=161358 RepID=A0ABW6SLR2_9ACTN